MEKNIIKILGAFGSRGNEKEMTCVQVSDNIVIDAGNILHALEDKALDINHIFLTHTHLDHIVDIPFLIDTFFDKRTKPLIIYGLSETITYLQEHLFNWYIWPDFSSINLKDSNKKAVIFKTLTLNEPIVVNECILKPIKTDHTDSSCGYVITKNDNSIFFTSDTYKCQNIWEEVNNNKSIKSVIIEVSFPSRFEQLAISSKHLTPKLLKEELQNLKRDDVTIYINHLKASYVDEISKECTNLKVLLNNGQVLTDHALIDISDAKNYKSYQFTLSNQREAKITQLINIGHALTSEKQFDHLMEKILLGAKQLSNADGGTLYVVSKDDKHLQFKVVQTDSLDLKMGGTNGEINWPPLVLEQEDGTLNKQQVAALCAIEGKLISIEDVYEADGFNFEGTKAFDNNTGYRTKSMLVVPMRNHENKTIGVIQLLNKKDQYGQTIPFNEDDKELISSMSSQAAVSMTNTALLRDLENLLYAFIESIATAIEAKSKYTGGHIKKVEELTSMISQSISKEKDGKYKDIHFSKDELKELSIAAWMHDIGKITTPEFVVDKKTKLETIYDRINFVEAKFEILKKEKEIEFLKSKVNCTNQDEIKSIETQYNKDIQQIENDLEFIKKTNIGSEFLDDESIKRLHQLQDINITFNNKLTPLLSDNEVENLSIKRGTLTEDERQVINNHAIMSYNMLKTLPFPKKYKNVPLIAGSHHKKIQCDENGVHLGYGAKEIMKLPLDIKARILAIADVFEAVSAHDRPYREPNTLNQSLKILSYMVKDNELDKDLVNYFIKSGLAQKYAKKHLLKSQLDDITVTIDEEK